MGSIPFGCSMNDLTIFLIILCFVIAFTAIGTFVPLAVKVLVAKYFDYTEADS